MYVFVIWTLHVIKCILLAPFSEVVNQSNKKKTPEGPSFAAAPVSLLTAESSTMPVEHTREEPECPTKVDVIEGIVI